MLHISYKDSMLNIKMYVFFNEYQVNKCKDRMVFFLNINLIFCFTYLMLILAPVNRKYLGILKSGKLL